MLMNSQKERWSLQSPTLHLKWEWTLWEGVEKPEQGGTVVPRQGEHSDRNLNQCLSETKERGRKDVSVCGMVEFLKEKREQ